MSTRDPPIFCHGGTFRFRLLYPSNKRLKYNHGEGQYQKHEGQSRANPEKHLHKEMLALLPLSGGAYS